MRQRKYLFFTGTQRECDDIMVYRMYRMQPDGSVFRYCLMKGTSSSIRQPISRAQCAREMGYLLRNGFTYYKVGE